jgi:hypothetical protein
MKESAMIKQIIRDRYSYIRAKESKKWKEIERSAGRNGEDEDVAYLLIN